MDLEALNNGWEIVNLEELAGAPSSGAGNMQIWSESDGLHFQNDSNERILTYAGGDTLTNLTLSSATTPTITITDTTTPVTATLSAGDSTANLQTTTAHSLVLGTNSTAAITINSSQAVTLAGNLTLSAGQYAQTYSNTATSGVVASHNITTTLTPSGTSTQQHTQQNATISTAGSADMSGALVWGFKQSVVHSNTNTLAYAIPFEFAVTLGSGGGNLTNAIGMQARVQNSSTSTITNATTMYVLQTLNTGGGAITNAYGLRIDDITVGDTLNYAILTGAGQVDFGGTMRSAGVIIDADPGAGVASTNTFTSVTDTPTTNPGWTTSSTVNMNAPDGYIKAYVGTQACVIPFWNT